jgi:hypothetical protein
VVSAPFVCLLKGTTDAAFTEL